MSDHDDCQIPTPHQHPGQAEATEDAAYLKHLQQLPEYWEQFLPSPLPLSHWVNQCTHCQLHGSPTNPTTIYAGQPPDLENGPSPADLPYTLCTQCMEGEEI